MSTSEVTAQISAEDQTLRVGNLFPKLEKYLTDQSKSVFKNVRTAWTADMLIYGRIVDEESDATCSDFAQRLNQLFCTFDGIKEYDYQGLLLKPVIASTLAPPMSIPLAPLGKRRCKVCNIEADGLMCIGLAGERHDPCGKFEIENPISRTMFLSYVFVENIDVALFHDSWEEVRIWLNTITKNFILAGREGMLPTNSAEIINVADMSKG